MLFAFVSCDDSASKPEEPKVEYADSEYAKALVESINKQKAFESIMNSVNNKSDDTLKILYEPIDFEPSSATEQGEDVSIKVTASVKNYVAGFHGDPIGIKGLKFVSGKAEVIVNGTFKKVADGYSFDLKSYAGKTLDKIVINDEKGEHEFEIKDLKGTASGTITASNPLEFSVENIVLQVPAAKDVDVYLDGKLVDYSKLCEDTGFKPGQDVSVK